MAARPLKRLRRLSTEYDDDSPDDWAPGEKSKAHSASTPAASSTNRPRRGVASPQKPAASVLRTRSLEDSRQSIHLTVKAPPSRLREITNGASSKRTGPSRGSRNKKPIIEESSDEEDEEDEDAEVADEEDEDAEGEEDVEMEDEDAEGEEDVEMEDEPQLIKDVKQWPPSVTITPAVDPTASTVEAKEVAMDDDDDEELSELESQDEEDEEDEGGDEDAEGEDEIVEEDAEGDEDAEGESDDETPSMSRSNTPDLSKLTRRQRAAYEENFGGGLMSLSNEAQKKKHLTAEEHAMRRAEMARRRKNLSEKRNEEEKMDTINRLLKKQAPKRRGRAKDRDAENDESAQENGEAEPEKANPLYVRYISNSQGTRVCVPEEWLDAPVGAVFNRINCKGPARPMGMRMVIEVEE